MANVFIDERVIVPGEPFPDALRTALKECNAMVIVIGRGWSTLSNEFGSRLAQPEDWVRAEIESALQQRIRVIPVLVDRAPMPLPGELPESIRSLTDLQAIDLRDASWDDDVKRLLSATGIKTGALRPALLVAAIAVLLIIGVLSTVAMLRPTEHTDAAVSSDRLTTLDPSQEQQEWLASRYSGSSMNVPVLRVFLAQSKQAGVPADKLDEALARFASRLHHFVYETDTLSLSGHSDMSSSGEVDLIRESIRTALTGDFDAALAQLPAIEPGRSPAKVANRGPWLGPVLRLYKRGQLQALRREWPEALALLDEAVSRTPDVPNNLRPSGLRQAAWVAEDLGDVQGAVRRLEAEEAYEGTQKGSASKQAQVALERAALLRRAGEPARALAAHRHAQKLFDRELDPGNAAARDSARLLAEELQRNGDAQEAAKLRARYGLAGADR